MEQKIEYLDQAIASEGSSADDIVVIAPRPHINTYEAFKEHPKYGKYFQPHVFKPYPAWIYHATEPAKLVGDAKTAASYGVSYNKDDHHWVCIGEWKSRPVVKPKPDVADTGKSLVTASSAQSANSTNELMAKILQQMQSGQSPAVAMQADPDYAEFLAFKRFKASQVTPETPAGLKALVEPPAPALSQDEEKAILVEAADSRGIKIDKRWGLDRIKEELDKAAA